MSRLKPQEEYEKTMAFHFFRWLSGSKDPYVGEVEMKPQKEAEITESTILERMNESQMIRDKIYDVENNKKLILFHKIYVACAILFSIILAGLLLYTVSCLPRIGNAGNPANNETCNRSCSS